jgi:hypothetical protein
VDAESRQRAGSGDHGNGDDFTHPAQGLQSLNHLLDFCGYCGDDIIDRLVQALQPNGSLLDLASNSFDADQSTGGGTHQHHDQEWTNASAFAVPASGSFGTCGTNSLRGPGLVNADFGVERKFPFTEKAGLTFRAEMFNIANTPHHSNPNGNVNSGSFMQAFGIVSTGREGIEQRALRFALRFAF